MFTMIAFPLAGTPTILTGNIDEPFRVEEAR
jgi:hypothetical protein